MADFGTFDLGRAYAQAEDVRGAQQARSLRDLQIQATRKELATPKTMSPEDTINHARILNGAMDSIIQNPSDENVKRVSAMLAASGSLPGNFDSAHILAEPLEQRVANATKAKEHFSTFLSGAVEPPKPAKPDSYIGEPGPDKFTGQSLQAYAQTVDPKTGRGNYSLLVPRPDVGGGQERSPYFTPVYTEAGVGSFNNRTGTMAPLAPGGGGVLKTTDDPEVRGAVTGAEEMGKLQAQRAQQIQVKVANMATMDSMLDEALPQIAVATGSGIGGLADKAAGWLGFSPSGADAIAALGVMSARLLEMVPRMEGPQSDADRATYEAAVGRLADPYVPRDQKIAAVRTIKSLNKKYKLEFDANAAAAPGAPAAGTVRKFNPATGRIE